MSQALLFAAVYLLGAMAAFAFGPRRDPLLCAALAFPVGMAACVFLTLSLLVLGLPVTQLSLGVVTAFAFAGASFAAIRRGALDRRALLIAAAWLVALGVLAWWAATHAILPKCASRVEACILNRRGYNHHENTLEVLARLGETRELALEQMWHRIPNTSFFMLLFHTVCELVDVEVTLPLSRVMRASLLALFVVVAWRLAVRPGATRWWRALALAVLAVILYRGLRIADRQYFLAELLPASIYLFAFVTLWFLAERRRDASPLPVALGCLAAFTLQAPETLLPGVLVLAIAALGSRLPRAQLARPLGAYTFGALLWLSFPATEDKFPDDDQLGMLLFAAAFVVWLSLGGRRGRRLAPFLAAALAGVGVVWLADAWLVDPRWTRQLLVVMFLPFALLFFAFVLRPHEPADPWEVEPAASPLAELGGRRRATALVFACIVTALLIGNVRLYFRNERKMTDRYQLDAHDLFDFMRAGYGR